MDGENESSMSSNSEPSVEDLYRGMKCEEGEKRQLWETEMMRNASVTVT
jgi:hypothetical protein